eukprot:4003844-Pleurochrysis_carterae.AAC.2
MSVMFAGKEERHGSPQITALMIALLVSSPAEGLVFDVISTSSLRLGAGVLPPDSRADGYARFGQALTDLGSLRIAIGAPYVSPANRSSLGAVYIVSLHENGTAKSLDSIIGHEELPLEDHAYFGTAVAKVSLDLDGTTLHLAASSRRYDTVYLLTLGPALQVQQYVPIRLQNLTQAFPDTLQGDLQYDSAEFGRALTALPDIDGDGSDELAVGASGTGVCLAVSAS